MKTTLKLIALIIASLFILNLSSVTQANTLRGSNTKIEANRIGNIWKVKVCTLYKIKINQGKPILRALGSKKARKIGNGVIREFKYNGSRKEVPKKGYWGKRQMRCYNFELDKRPLTRIKAKWARIFLKPGSKPPVLVVIGRATGVVTLNV